VVYLRPETAQGVFVNFKNIQRSMRKKIPFGVCNAGKSFRNEITPGNFTFRTREFEQMEMEFFCKPGTDLEWFKYWKDYCLKFVESLGPKAENFVSVTMSRLSSPSIAKPRPTSNTTSRRLAGAKSSAWPIEPTTI
jgi:glycyl-tRNA synthetase (class II)